MKNKTYSAIFAMSALVMSFTVANTQAFAAKVGEPAPGFIGTDSNGNTVDLSQYKGKYVVLEWHNKDCPYVKTQYNSGNMQRAQDDATKKGAIWLSVVSSAPKAEGAVDAASANKDIKDTGAHVTAMILDTNGKIGHAYDAKTTPHMFVIDPKGNLIYNGAVDASSKHDNSDVTKDTQNYVTLALNESMAGKPLSHPTSKPFGCSVKY